MTTNEGRGNNVAVDRRAFLAGVGLAVLTVQCLPANAYAAWNDKSDDPGATDNLVIHSSAGFLWHVHDLLIPRTLLEAPPVEGVTLTSTKALHHQHQISLSQRELITANQGGTVRQRASSHVFIISIRPQEVAAQG